MDPAGYVANEPHEEPSHPLRPAHAAAATVPAEAPPATKGITSACNSPTNSDPATADFAPIDKNTAAVTSGLLAVADEANADDGNSHGNTAAAPTATTAAGTNSGAVAESPKEEDEDDDDDGLITIEVDSDRLARHNHLAALTLFALNILTSGMWVVFLAIPDFLAPYDKPKGYYNTETSCFDVAMADFAITLCTIAIALVVCRWLAPREEEGWPRRLAVVTFFNFILGWILIAVVAKFWMYRGWPDLDSVGDSVGFVVTLLGLVARLCVTITWIDDPSQHKIKVRRFSTAARWGAIKKVLRPYVIPKHMRNRILVLGTWVVLLASKAATLIQPIILRDIVNKLASDVLDPEAYTLVVAYTFLGFAPKLLAEIQDIFYFKVGQTAFTEVAELTFTHVHRLSLHWHLNKKMGGVIASIDRGQEAADKLMYWVAIVMFPTLATGVATFIVFIVEFNQPQIAAVCFLGFMTYCWYTLGITLWRRHFREEMNDYNNLMNEKASDSLINFETVKYFSNEKFEIEQYTELVRSYQKGDYYSQAVTSMMNATQSSISYICMLGALAIATYRIFNRREDGTLDTGEFVAVQSYVLTIFAPLNVLGWVYGNIIDGAVDIQNISEILCEKPDIVDRPNAVDFGGEMDEGNHESFAKKGAMTTSQPRALDASVPVGISFKDVRFRYPAQPEGAGIMGVSFEVPAGTMTAIVGETGSARRPSRGCCSASMTWRAERWRSTA